MAFARRSATFSDRSKESPTMKTATPSLRSLLGLALILFLAPTASAQVSALAPSQARGSYAASRAWIPGHYETLHERVWVPGWTERIWIEPAFEWRRGPCGARFRVQVCAGYWRSVHHPGHYEIRAIRVWRPGYWAARICG
jgi:hypothetical protein